MQKTFFFSNVIPSASGSRLALVVGAFFILTQITEQRAEAKPRPKRVIENSP